MTVLVLNDAGRVKSRAEYETAYLKRNEETVEITESELSSVFEDAKAGDGTLDGADASIDAAVENPLLYLDYLILVDGTIEFDPDYSRSTTNQ